MNRVRPTFLLGMALAGAWGCAGAPDPITTTSSGSSASSGSEGAGGDGGRGTTASASGTGGEGGDGGQGTTASTSSTGVAGGGTMGVCGDGALDSGEECDDGNTAVGDGCSAGCKLEFTGPEDVCPGLDLPLTGTGADQRKGSLTGSTAGLLNHYGSSCGGSGADAVYVVMSDVVGQLTATLTADYDAVLYARASCADGATEITCNDSASLMGGEKISFQVAPGTPYYFFIDGYGGGTGAFTLDVTIDTAFCGNGVAEAPEQCDDGAVVTGDGCDSACMIEPGGIVDNCPGQNIYLTAGASISLLGDTTLLASSQSTLACLGSGNNQIYAVTPDAAGALVLDMVATYDNAALHVRDECSTSTTQSACIEAAEPGQHIGFSVPVLANTTYYVIADATSSTYKGTFQLEVTLSPALCGNHVLDGGEGCDDGNAVAGDGCDPICFLEAPAQNNDVCPGQALTLSGSPEHARVTATTATLVADQKALVCLTSTTSRDAVYMVTPSINGLLTAVLDAGFDGGLHAHTVCGSVLAADQLGCSDAFNGVRDETLKIPVKAGIPYYLVVDAPSVSTTTPAAYAGLFQLDVTVTPGACGNGTIEGGEVCDDGNQTAGDGCDPTCLIEPPGPKDTCPGEVLPLTLQGNVYVGSVSAGTTNLVNDVTLTGCTSVGRDAVYAVTPSIDGVLKAQVPTAAFNVSLGARLTCATAASQIVCANDNSGLGAEALSFAVTQGTTYYLVVDSTTAAAFGLFQLNVTVVPPGCGDNQISANEQCDDGNTVAGDGCDAVCQLEPLAGNDVCPGHALALAGTGAEPRTATVTSDTTALASNYGGTCGGSGHDAVYVVTPDIGGTLTVGLGAGYPATLYARSSCADAATELGCDKASPFQLSFPATAGTPVYLFVDGFSGAFGPSTLQITVTP